MWNSANWPIRTINRQICRMIAEWTNCPQAPGVQSGKTFPFVSWRARTLGWTNCPPQNGTRTRPGQLMSEGRWLTLGVGKMSTPKWSTHAQAGSWERGRASAQATNGHPNPRALLEAGGQPDRNSTNPRSRSARGGLEARPGGANPNDGHPCPDP